MNPNSKRQRVLAVVREHGPVLSKVVAFATDIPTTTVHNILSDLGRAGLIVAEPVRGGRGCQWRLATLSETTAVEQALEAGRAERATAREAESAAAGGPRVVRLTDTRHNQTGLSPGYRPDRWSPSY